MQAAHYMAIFIKTFFRKNILGKRYMQELKLLLFFCMFVSKHFSIIIYMKSLYGLRSITNLIINNKWMFIIFQCFSCFSLAPFTSRFRSFCAIGMLRIFDSRNFTIVSRSYCFPHLFDWIWVSTYSQASNKKFLYQFICQLYFFAIVLFLFFFDLFVLDLQLFCVFFNWVSCF